MQTKTWLWIIGLVVVLGGLFAYPRFYGGQNGSGIGSGVPCLTPNMPLLQHIHPVVTIMVNGAREEIPANIGLAECERAVHTHDDDAAQGVIHVESQDRRSYTLGDFFAVWGRPVMRENHTLTVTADGAYVENPETLTFSDGQDIQMEYLEALPSS